MSDFRSTTVKTLLGWWRAMRGGPKLGVPIGVGLGLMAATVVLAGLLPGSTPAGGPDVVRLDDHAVYTVTETRPAQEEAEEAVVRVGTLEVKAVRAELVMGADTRRHVGLRTDWMLAFADDEPRTVTMWLRPGGTGHEVLAVSERIQSLWSWPGQGTPGALLGTSVTNTTQRILSYPAQPWCLFGAQEECRVAPFWDWTTEATPALFPTQLEATAKDGAVVLSLATLARGSVVPAAVDVVEGPGAPALRHAPFHPWGPEDSGATFGFLSPREAYEAALADPEAPWFKQWVEDHPAHAIVAMDHGYGFNVNEKRASLTLVLQSPEGPLGMMVQKRALWTWPQSSPLEVPLPYRTLRATIDPGELASLPAWEQLPAEWPTWESIQERWHAVTVPAASTAEISRPQMAWQCPDASDASTCKAPRLLVMAGHALDEYDLPGLSGSKSPSSRHFWSNAWMDAEGRLVRLDEGTEQQDQEALVDGLAFDGPMQGTQAAPEAAWSWPGGKALATASVVGTTAAGLVLLWATLKGAPLFAAFSRVHGDPLLRHPSRAAILDAVAARPGLHFQGIVRAAGLSNGAAVHHVRKLVASGFLAEERRAGATCYFRAGAGAAAKAREAAPALRSESARRVLAALQARPGLSVRELARASGLSPATAHHHVARLRAADLLEPGRAAPSARGEAALAQLGLVSADDALAARA